MIIQRVSLGKSANGIEVWFDPVSSHAATHMTDTPELRALVREIVALSVLEGQTVEFEHDMGRVVGESDLVKNDSGDEIVYAKRLNRDVYTPFNKTKRPIPYNGVSVSFGLEEDGTYQLHSAWIGPMDSPPFPGDEHETAGSQQFWSENSLAWGRQAIQEETLSSICPW